MCWMATNKKCIRRQKKIIEGKNEIGFLPPSTLYNRYKIVRNGNSNGALVVLSSPWWLNFHSIKSKSNNRHSTHEKNRKLLSAMVEKNTIPSFLAKRTFLGGKLRNLNNFIDKTQMSNISKIRAGKNYAHF